LESALGGILIGAIYWLGTVAAVLVNITALTLLAQRWMPYPATARTAAIAIICLGLFSLEHFIGLGRLYAVGIPLTALSAYFIWYERARFHEENVKTDQVVHLGGRRFRNDRNHERADKHASFGPRSSRQQPLPCPTPL
jgi:hypothetical protein